MQTKILDALLPENRAEAIEEAARLLKRGELVAFPTETVYGLGADALNPDAIARVFEAKGRPSDNPLIVHVADPAGLPLCAQMNRRAELLAGAFMPGPLTLVLPSHAAIPSIARGGLSTVALRVPAHPVASALLGLSGPLVAPSANLSGRPSPTTARHVYDDLAGRIPAILDGGACTVGIESTVVDLSGERAVLLRPGIITPEELERVLGEPVLAGGGDESAPRSPGMKYRHYAPSARVRLIASPEDLAALPAALSPGQRMILTTSRHFSSFSGANIHLLRESSLYALFREADAAGIAEIIICAAPDELDPALWDRIRKAAA